jgi:hypothetical protein
VGKFLNFFYQRFLKKKGCIVERIFRRLGCFDFQKQFTNSIYGEHVVETFNFTFASKIKFPFQKAVFTKDIAKFS